MVMPIHRVIKTLTGKSRGRITRFGAVVMQLEVQCDVYEIAPPPLGNVMNTYNIWRDATRDDLTQGQNLPCRPPRTPPAMPEVREALVNAPDLVEAAKRLAGAWNDGQVDEAIASIELFLAKIKNARSK